MRKIVVLLLVAFVLFSATGCMKVRKVIRERVDQEVTGNQGVIYGDVPPAETPTEPKMREYYEVDVELPPFGMKETEYKKYEQVSDGVVIKDSEGKPIIKETTASYRPASSYATEEIEVEEVYEEVEIEPAKVTTVKTTASKPEFSSYTVKSGQSLWKIAKEVYGDPNRWNEIYEANKEKIKDPNRLKQGLVLNIPQ